MGHKKKARIKAKKDMSSLQHVLKYWENMRAFSVALIRVEPTLTEVLGEHECVQCRTHEDQFEVLSTRRQLLQDNHQEVGLQVTFVDLVQDHV